MGVDCEFRWKSTPINMFSPGQGSGITRGQLGRNGNSGGIRYDNKGVVRTASTPAP